MKKEKMYNLAIRKRDSENDYFWNHNDFVFSKCRINCKGRYWLADPFLFEKDGVLYLFYEAFDLIERRGKIAYSRMVDGNAFTEPKVVIDKKYHLSFPNIFSYNGEIYIMPESSGDYRVKLFKAKSFPDIWEPADVLLPDAYACDNIIMDGNGYKYLLINEMYHHAPNGLYSSCWVKNYIYKIDGFNVKSEGIKVSEGDFGIRNAGKSFYVGEKLYRIGQDCRNNEYGRGLVLFEVDSLEPYKERIVWDKDKNELKKHIDCNDPNSIIGVHTYNFSQHYEIIDFSQILPLSIKVKLGRRLKPFSKRVNKLLRCFNAI